MYNSPPPSPPPPLIYGSQVKVCSLLEWCCINSIGVSGDHSQLRCKGFAGRHQRKNDYLDRPIYYSIKRNQVNISFNKCGITMASIGNINRGIQSIIDVIDYKMLKGKYLVGMLSAHPMGLHNQPMRLINSSVR